MALYHQGRYREASTELTIAERTLKDDPLLYDYAGLAAAEHQSYEQASEKFLRAGKLDPELASDARYQRGATLHSQRQFQQATAEFRSAVEGGTAVAAQQAPTTDSSPLSASFEAVERHLWPEPAIRLECRAAAGRIAAAERHLSQG